MALVTLYYFLTQRTFTKTMLRLQEKSNDKKQPQKCAGITISIFAINQHYGVKEVQMIDTVRFYTSNFTVGDNARLEKQSVYKDNIFHEKDVLYKIKGRDVYADKAFINDNEAGIYLTIKSVPKIGIICGVQCSVPKVLYKKNYVDYSPDDFNIFVDKLKAWQKENDIYFDIENGDVTRLDNSFNCETETDINNYFVIFKNSAFSRLQKYDYGSTLLFRNTRRQITVYDKYSEIMSSCPVQKSNKLDYMNCQFPDLPHNLLRFEYRKLNKNIVSQKVKDLNINIYDNYIYALQQFFMLVDSGKKNLNVENIFDSLSEYKNIFERKFFDKFLIDYAVVKLCESQEPDILINFIDKFGLKPYQKTRIKKMIRENAKLKFKSSSLVKLADELKLKIEKEIKKYE